MAGTAELHDGRSHDATVSELVKQISEQTSRLARQEVQLAQAELAVKAKHAGVGLGLFGGAGTFVFYGAGALVAAAILGLATAVDGWLAALIVATVLFALAGALALLGRKQVTEAAPPVPEEATESVKEDIQFAKARAQAGRR